MQVYVPTVSIMFRYQGRDVFWSEGRTTIEEGHPILKGRENLVRPLQLDFAVSEPAAEPRAQRVALEPAGEAGAAVSEPASEPSPEPERAQPASRRGGSSKKN